MLAVPLLVIHTYTEIVRGGRRAAADELGQITSEVAAEDLLDATFAEFCIGK